MYFVHRVLWIVNPKCLNLNSWKQLVLHIECLIKHKFLFNWQYQSQSIVNKKSPMGFVHRVFLNSKSLMSYFVWNHQHVEKFENNSQFFLGCPQELDHRFMYIAPSSDNSLLTLILPFIKSESKELWVFFSFKMKSKKIKIHLNPPILCYVFL